MKTISSALQSHLQQETTTLATCWKVTRRDATVMGFTDHDRDLTVDGQLYKAATGFTPTAISTNAALSVDNLDVNGLLSDDDITEEDILSGVYDFAEIEIFQVDYTVPDNGMLILRRGWFGEVMLQNGQFVAEIRGLTQKLSQQVGQFYSPICRAQLGDNACMISLASYTHAGSVTTATSRSVFSDSGRKEDTDYFLGGVVTFTSGANEGLSMEVKEFAQGRFVFVLPLPHDLEVGDGYSAVAGCDRRFETCAEKFGNALNFRGEPHVPGIDRMLETSSTRSNWE